MEDRPVLLAWSWINIFEALHYSLRTTLLLRPENVQLHGLAAFINTLQTVFSPILLGLLALAIRQRLKR